MVRRVGQVLLFSLTAALNPTLVAATSMMLLLPRPARLMLGYLCGAVMTSVTLGLVIVLSFSSSSTTTTTQHTVSPIADLALGGIALVLAFVLHRAENGGGARRAKKKEKGPPRWQQVLSRGSPRATFAIGALLTLPGASYIAALHAIHELHQPTSVEVLLVIAVNLVMLILLEGPLISFAVAPDWTPRAIDRVKAAIGRNWRQVAVKGLLVIGLALIVKGALALIIQ